MPSSAPGQWGLSWDASCPGAGESESHLYVAVDQGYITRDELEKAKGLVVESKLMIGGLMTYLRKCEMKGYKFVRKPQRKA